MSHVAMLALEFGDANVVVTSLVLVFGMLVALCLIITLEGKMMDRAEKPAAPKPAAPKPAAPARKPAPAPAAPAVETGIPAEVVAAIAAAVACTEGSAVIRAVRRAPAAGSRRGNWGDAGVVANTTPFMA
ncbi:OadG family protein [Gemmiger formicilis]|uniref:OadG family transporter subunit n=1 Tax=Gemmiger formicilis TaxID=745368 RepID=UPI00195E0570|nr:OadG family transporter subunit [Gemmiger formicilis]MBM6717678.1 OadG family protein [Gemmiger formicilis]